MHRKQLFKSSLKTGHVWQDLSCDSLCLLQALFSCSVAESHTTLFTTAEAGSPQGRQKNGKGRSAQYCATSQPQLCWQCCALLPAGLAPVLCEPDIYFRESSFAEGNCSPGQRKEGENGEERGEEGKEGLGRVLHGLGDSPSPAFS